VYSYISPPPQSARCEEVLPEAEAPGPRVLSTEEQRRLAEQEENTLRELRLFLRDVTKRLATDKRFNIFSKPVDIDEVKEEPPPPFSTRPPPFISCSFSCF